MLDLWFPMRLTIFVWPRPSASDIAVSPVTVRTSVFTP